MYLSSCWGEGWDFFFSLLSPLQWPTTTPHSPTCPAPLPSFPVVDNRKRLWTSSPANEIKTASLQRGQTEVGPHPPAILLAGAPSANGYGSTVESDLWPLNSLALQGSPGERPGWDLYLTWWMSLQFTARDLLIPWNPGLHNQKPQNLGYLHPQRDLSSLLPSSLFLLRQSWVYISSSLLWNSVFELCRFWHFLIVLLCCQADNGLR